MASAIHHGPPSSFKSNSVVQRYGIKALMDGRTVISNIRGFDSLETIKDVYFDDVFPESARLIFFETSTKAARDIFACWYKWIPFQAFIIIDEAQTIYPDRADFKLEHLDRVEIPADFFAIEHMPEPRPVDVFTAFDKQRHYQWDIFLTTTNISKIKRDIRESSEWAYRHRSLSEISRFFKGQWYEHQHDPENNGKSDSHRLGKPKKYTVDKRVFKCYQSTATGEHTASQAGTTLFSDRGIRIKLYGIVFALVLAVSLVVYKLNHKSVQDITIDTVTTHAVKPVSQAVIPAASKDTDKINATFVNPLSTVKIDTSHDNVSHRWRISGSITNKKTNKTFIIATDLGGHSLLLNKSACFFDEFNQPSCFIDQKSVTKFTGSYFPDSNKPTLSKID